jgi:hypothetical protein
MSESAEPSPEEQQSSDELLITMGHALASWQGVEHAVFDIFRCFFDPDHVDVAATSFFAVRTFEARTQMTEALIEQFSTEQHRSAWADLRAQIRKKSKKRNAIAHGLFAFFGQIARRSKHGCLVSLLPKEEAKFRGDLLLMGDAECRFFTYNWLMT